MSEPARTHSDGRVLWLDGVRGAAALFVVFHHVWLTAWPGFPSNTGPFWLGWLLYGHLAVAVFIVVSGFSLALVPLRNGGRLPGGVGRFVKRRAWRILPAYWAALVFSVILTALLLTPDATPGAVGKGFAVHGLLLQDIVGSQSPNGAFWSIAIEWQIYFVFPLILLIGRLTSLRIAVLATAGAVVLGHLVAASGAPLDRIDHLTPQFLALFALGALAAQIGGTGDPSRRRWLGAAAGAAFVGFVAIAAAKGSEWVVGHFFTMDLLFGVGVACAIAAIHAGGIVPARRVLTAPAALWLGLFSYSIYLVHAPLVLALHKYVFGPMAMAPLPTFTVTLFVGVPLILVVAYGFHLMFEAPFLRRRDLGALATLPGIRHLRRARTPQGVAPTAPPVAGERPA